MTKLFEATFTQQNYIDRLNDIFKSYSQNGQIEPGKGLAEIIYLLEQIPHMQAIFFHFWFHNLLTEPQQRFIDVLNPKFFNIWNLTAKELSSDVEKYIAALVHSNQQENALAVLEKAVGYKILIEPIFIEKLIEEQAKLNNNTVTTVTKVFSTKLKNILPKIKENIIADFKNPR